MAKIYRRNFLEGIGVPPEVLGFGAALLAIAVILLVLVGIPGGNVVHAELLQNPISLEKNDSSVLHIKITNPLEETVTGVRVYVQTPGTTQLSVYPQEHVIQKLGPRETRELEFVVLPLDTGAAPFLPGEYKIDVMVELKGTHYQRTRTLIVEK